MEKNPPRNYTYDSSGMLASVTSYDGFGDRIAQPEASASSVRVLHHEEPCTEFPFPSVPKVSAPTWHGTRPFYGHGD